MLVKELIKHIKQFEYMDIPELEYMDESYVFAVSFDGFVILGFEQLAGKSLEILEDMRLDFVLETCIRVKL